MAQNQPTSDPSLLEKPATGSMPEREVPTHPKSGAMAPTVVGQPTPSPLTVAPSVEAIDTLVGNADSNAPPTTSPQSLGPYQILEKLGEGGMGAVYKARHTRLDKMVAVKILPFHLTRDADALARFDREMKAVGRLEHPGIVRAMDAGEVNGTHYLAMELVDGQDVQKYLAKRGKLPVNMACRIIRQAAAALSYAHEHGMVHRDIKPSNLFLTKSGQVKVLDLGLARLAHNDQQLTSTGHSMGTPDYMAPEQWDDSHRVDHRCDLYSLGCTLFQLLVGRAPYADDAHRTMTSKMKAHAMKPIPNLRALRPDVPEELAAIYTSLMAKEVAERLESAKLLVDQLLPFCRSEPAAEPTNEVLGSATISTAKASLRDDPPSTKAINPTSATAADKSPPRRSSRIASATAGGAAALLLLGVIIITIINKDGTKTKVEVAEGSKIEITSDAKSPLTTSLSPLAASSWQGWPADAPPPAIAPYDAEQAKQHQEAWAKYLQIEVEYTNTIGMKFRLIPPGEFTMGSTPEEIEAALKDIDPNDKHWQECIKSEAPPHKVILTQPIYLGVNEVTQAEYEQVMGSNPAHFGPMGAGKEAVAGMDTASHPVDMSSWNDALDFCVKLSQLEKLKPFYLRSGDTITPLDGTGYRLPSEAEWESACRAGTTPQYWIKDEELNWAGWLGGNSGGRTHAVGELRANPFGLYDVHGNVEEWVEDWWEPMSYNQFSEKPAFNPNGPSSGSQRVVRGGNWTGSASYCRAAFRSASDPTYRNPSRGFRLSLVAVSPRVSRP